MKNTENIKIIPLMLLAMASWGGAWTSGKLIVDTGRPEVLLFWRFLFSSLPMIPLLMIYKEKLYLSGKMILLLILTSVLYTGYNHLFFLGIRLGTAGAGGVLVTTITPLITFLLTIIYQKHILKRSELFGLLLGLMGGALILNIGRANVSQLFQNGNIYFIISAFCWAILTLLLQKIQKELNFLWSGFIIYTISCIFSFFLALPFGLFSLKGSAALIAFNIGYISLISTVFGTTVFFLAASKLGSRQAGSFLFLVPATALLSSWIFLKEIPSVTTLIGGAMAILAVYLINKSSDQPVQNIKQR